MDFKLPELGEGVYEAELVDWLVKPGDSIKRGHNLMEVLTDKATMEVPAAFAGTIDALSAKPGEQIKVGQVVLQYTPSGKSSTQEIATENNERTKENKTVAAQHATNGPQLAAPMSVKAAPSVRLMARKLGVDITLVEGSGPHGRVLIDDLSQHLTTTDEKRPSKRKPIFDYGKPGTRVKFVGLRRKIAEHMVASKTTIPHYSYVDQCDVTDLVRMRRSLHDALAPEGIKVTYLTFVVQAVVRALKEIPIVNSTLEKDSEEIVLHDRYHIGIAVATQNGLIVPVIHNADKKNFREIAGEVERLSVAARTGKIKREDLQDGTFTVTSIGNIGGLFATPIIHYPQVGILGVGKIVKRPVYDDSGNVRPADMVYLSFSFDHRVLDGAVGAAFGNAVIRHLQNPASLLL